MFDTLLIVALMVLLAIVTGYALDLRDANVQLQDSHDYAMRQAAETAANLRFNVEYLGHACDRYAHYDRVQVRKIADQAKEIHDLTSDLEQLKDTVSDQAVELLKYKLGAVVLEPVVLDDEQQQAIDQRVTALQTYTC